LLDTMKAKILLTAFTAFFIAHGSAFAQGA
jgi:hypothetical protein